VKKAVFPALILLSRIGIVAAQTPAERTKEPEELTISATEVQIDVTVRDKRGRVVKDMSASDFQVYEANDLQEITSCQLSPKTKYRLLINLHYLKTR